MQRKYTPVFISCLSCGKSFRIPPSTISRKKYCSVKCRIQGTTKSVHERFWAKVQKSDGCWGWTGCTNRLGYGRLGNMGAHRVSWQIASGPIPEGMCVCHKCDNPPCCNPDHLFIGTLKDNAQDMARKGRSPKKPALNQQQAMVLRKKHTDGGVSIKDLCKEYGVGRSAIYRAFAR